MFAVGRRLLLQRHGGAYLEPAWEVAPLCLFSGIAFIVSYWLSAQVSAKFLNLMGALSSPPPLRQGYFVPDKEWDLPDGEEWPAHWVETIKPGQADAPGVGGGTDDVTIADGGVDRTDMSLLRTWAAYILLVVIRWSNRSRPSCNSSVCSETTSSKPASEEVLIGSK